MRIVIKPGGAIVVAAAIAAISFTAANAARKVFNVPAKSAEAKLQTTTPAAVTGTAGLPAEPAAHSITSEVVQNPLSFGQRD